MKYLCSYINLCLPHYVSFLGLQSLLYPLTSCCRLSSPEADAELQFQVQDVYDRATPWIEWEEAELGRERSWTGMQPSTNLSQPGRMLCSEFCPTELSCIELNGWDFILSITHFPVVSCRLWVWEWFVTPSNAAHCSWGGPWRSWHLEAGLPTAFSKSGQETSLEGRSGWCIPHVYHTPPSYNLLLFSYV